LKFNKLNSRLFIYTFFIGNDLAHQMCAKCSSATACTNSAQGAQVHRPSLGYTVALAHQANQHRAFSIHWSADSDFRV